MVNWDLLRAPTSTLLTTRLGAENGVPVETCLRGTRLRPEQLDDPRTEITAKQDLRVVSNLLDALGHPPLLGLESGLHYHLTTYGIWGFALLSSPTLRSAMQVGLQYLDLTFSLGRIQAHERDDEVRLVLAAPDIPITLRRFVVERDAAAIMTILNELFAAPIAVSRVGFAFPPPTESHERYAEIFGVAPVFDADESCLAFDAASIPLDLPLPQASEHTSAMAQAQCWEVLARRQARAGLAGQVRDVIVARLAAAPAAAQVATSLHLSERTLRHRLAAEGTSFRALVDEVREQLAEELLVTAGLPVAQIAQRLGYAEVSSFSHAFHRWKGVGPRAYRAGQPAHRH